LSYIYNKYIIIIIHIKYKINEVILNICFLYLIINIKIMNIAIIDFSKYTNSNFNIIFPNAHYFTIINDKNINFILYSHIFIILSLYDININTKNYNNDLYIKFNTILNMNKIKNIYIFDIHKLNYDPNNYISNPNIKLFFKFNYTTNKIYKTNVLPFSFLFDNYISIIKTINNKKPLYINPLNRIYLITENDNDNDNDHENDKYKLYKKYLYYDNTKNKLHNINISKFCIVFNDYYIDLFEILSQGSLCLIENNNFKWCFNDFFPNEIIFTDYNDFLTKYNKLNSDDLLYKKCLTKQNDIFNKYFNNLWISSYLLNIITENDIK